MLLMQLLIGLRGSVRSKKTLWGGWFIKFGDRRGAQQVVPDVQRIRSCRQFRHLLQLQTFFLKLRLVAPHRLVQFDDKACFPRDHDFGFINKQLNFFLSEFKFEPVGIAVDADVARRVNPSGFLEHPHKLGLPSIVCICFFPSGSVPCACEFPWNSPKARIHLHRSATTVRAID